MDNKIEKYIGEARVKMKKLPTRKFDELIKEGSMASVYVNGVMKYSGKVVGKYGDGFRFKDGSTEIEVELK